ncbi:cytochrome b/b6 domain-containing protein [Helicobacter sp. MIT 11-5569]|uniref:formate dehydrogenase subunit gamma n=1 Tax=Helicobacter sp. MIT 11-5569 TaxID=1548151 RepID=UPI00051FD92C|nr:cytochrome b/b6 domain-containing protein [Helicobacter sp. MIT 11-5569]TLD82650.1 cytochrome b/b6 domain-containing protein [Helicobacter sp. MIT 11-5569]
MPNKQPKIMRQSAQNRIVHWSIAISIFGLIFTGILQMPVSKRYMLNELPLMGWSGDYHISLIVHYIFAAILCFFVFFHIVFHSGRKEFDIMPKKGDFSKSIAVIKAMLLKTQEPPSEKYLPEQRLAYLGIAFVILLLVITGIIKTYKNLSGFNLSEDVMFWVTQLHNLGMFLMILAIIGHLAAFIFKENRPLLSGMFSGKIDAKYVLHRHSLWKEGVESAKKAQKAYKEES